MTGENLICYCPCAGRDVGLALTWLGSHLSHFVFCDSGYLRHDMSGRSTVPADWKLLHLPDSSLRPPIHRAERSGTRKVIETWQRPDGTAATLEFLSSPAEACLASRFGAGTISALLHINDGTGEGGSDLWFLGSPGRCQAEASRYFLPLVAERLTDEALVITDGVLTDYEFASPMPFRRNGRYWEPIGPLHNTRVRDRPVTVWRSIREEGPQW